MGGTPDSKILNTTFFGNTAATSCGAILDSGAGISLLIKNSIFWKNEAPRYGQIDLLSELAEISYSDIQDGYVGIGNIDNDPRFVKEGSWFDNNTPDNPDDDFWLRGDYHLKSGAGHWDADTSNWKEDDVTSPCIDAGDPAFDYSQENDPNGDRINMGAYGGTREASLSSD